MYIKRHKKEIPDVLNEQYDEINVDYLLNDINDPCKDYYFVPITNENGPNTPNLSNDELDETIEKKNEFQEEKERMKEIEKE
jgi:hypothetical protein